MKRLLPLALLVLSLCLPAVANAERNVLTFEKKIGVGGQSGWSGWMSFVAFSGDGRMVASDGPAGPNDATRGLTFWSFPAGHFIKSLGFPPRSISPDWRFYASDHAVVDVESGTPLISLTETDGERALSTFSHDGRYVAVSTNGGRSDGTRIRIVRTADGSVVSRFGRRTVFSMAFHPDSERLASGHWDNVTLWNALTGQRMALLRGFGRYVYGIGFSADGTLLAAGTDAGVLQLWNVATGQRLRSIDLGGGQLSDPVFSPDGRLVAVGAYGFGTVSVVDVQSGEIVGMARVSGLGCGSVAFSPDGRYLITPSTGGLVTWPYDDGGTIRVFEVHHR